MPQVENTAISRPRRSDAVPGYKLEGMVGRGGMGEVHRATQLSLGRTVALKLLSTHLVQDESFVARFEKEAVALASLSHPNIVSIVDKGKADDTYYLVMEYVDGPSLREVMRSPMLDSGGALRITLDICRAIDYAHGRGVIHRDLKPENILFDEQAGGIPKVTDFGLADFLDGRGPTRFNVTQTHMGMGTASYMAPEQRIDAKSADQRADIYSLGVILYEVLTGEVPVGNFAPVSQLKPGVDKRVDAIIARCLKPAPSERYQKVSEIIADLEPFAPVGSSPLRKPTRAETMALQVQKVARVAWRTAIAVVVGVAAFIILIAYLRAKLAPEEESAGEALTLETLEKRALLDGQWRISGEDYWLGEGANPLALHPYGRQAVLQDKAIVFPAPRGDMPLSGRVGPDLAGEDAQGLRFSSELTMTRAPESFLRRVKHLIRGTQQRPRAALLLLGHPGRYVALVAPEEGAPLSLEWRLGERAGTMIGPEISAEGQKLRLELRVNGLGELSASVGDEKERRAVGEPVLLGIDWQRHFGGVPSPAVGCLEGVCRFETFRHHIDKPPPPPPPPPSAPAPPPVSKASGSGKGTAKGSGSAWRASSQRKVQVPKPPKRRDSRTSTKSSTRRR